MPQVHIADERVAAVVLPAIKLVFQTVRAGWSGPGFGLCMKVATLTMLLLDEEAGAKSQAGPEERLQYQQDAERIARALFAAVMASGGPLN